MLTRRRLLSGMAGLSLLGLAPPGVIAADRFFRIGTGPAAGTYYPVGSLMAAALSSPSGGRACDEGGACGVPGLIAVAQTSGGSIDNISLLTQGLVDSAFCQADVAFLAYRGETPFEGTPYPGLRAIAYLYSEVVHLVARTGAGIYSVKDLKGKRISLDAEGSGTRIEAELILRAMGLTKNSFDGVELPASLAADALVAGELDAFFLVAGSPTPVVSQLADAGAITLIGLGDEAIGKMQADYPFLTPEDIPAGTYFNLPYVPSLAVGAIWLTLESQPAQFVQELTRALWQPASRQILTSGHPRAAEIRLSTATRGISLPPLHDGALAYYREVGMSDPSLPGSSTQ